MTPRSPAHPAAPVNRRGGRSVVAIDGVTPGYGGVTRTIRLEAALGALATPALLAILSVTAGLGVAGWIAGLAVGWATTALLAIARIRSGTPMILPPDWVTLARGLLSAGVAGLVADSFQGPLPVPALIVVASAALVLDAVDGPVARRTGTATPLGGRFDGEVDAFLILVLSVAVARDYGPWVLAIGAARYALLAAGWAVPWLAAQLPYRYWRKVVAAAQGIALTAAASGFLPRPAAMVAVGVALALLTESFGRDVLWLYRTGAGARARRVVRTATALAAAGVLWAVLVAPGRPDRFTPGTLLRIPLEGLAVVAIGLLLPRRPRTVLAAGAGVVFGLLTVVKVLDLGFYEQLGRPFDPLVDWSALGPAVGVMSDSVGSGLALVVVVLVGLALLLVVGLVTASSIRIVAGVARHRRRWIQGVALVAAGAVLSLVLAPGYLLVSTNTAELAIAQGRDTAAAVSGQERFRTAISSTDPYAAIPASDLLGRLRGKDVIVAFVESYGRVAVEGTPFSSGVDAVLRRGTATLRRAGYSARSAFLRSPTFGGISWLAHSTLQSGLWVDDQHRYDQLVAGHRFTLSAAFRKAGWRTVADIPSDDRTWRQGTSFYHYDRIYDRRNVGYRGPTFSYASMPDQYTLAAFQRLELAPGHSPVMAEIDLVSSHTPWTPLPTMVPWDQVGDGSVFDPMPAQGLSPDVAWRNRDTVRRLYGQSIQYSLQALVSWVTRLHDDKLVLVLLGDHQPAATVSGSRADHAVPISIVARDRDVLGRIASWRWQEGLLPSPTAPEWPMDRFRNRFLDAFSARSPAGALAPIR